MDGYGYNLRNLDLDRVGVESVDDGVFAFHQSLDTVLERIAPLTAATGGLAPEDRARRLCAAVNVALDTLEEVTGMADPACLPNLIERIAELAVTGSAVEVQIGVAGDLRIDQRNRLTVDELLTSCARVPLSMRAIAQREAVGTLQRLLALLLLHGWAEGADADERTRQQARHAIVDAVQGHLR